MKPENTCLNLTQIGRELAPFCRSTPWHLWGYVRLPLTRPAENRGGYRRWRPPSMRTVSPVMKSVSISATTALTIS